MKILLDAGHYKNYNRGKYTAYYEGNMTWKLVNYVKEHLEKNYVVTVDLTFNSLQTKENGVYFRGAKAKGYDAFYSFHSNATDDSSVTRVVIIRNAYTTKYDAYAKELGDAIKKTMGITQNTQVWYKKTSSGNEYYGVLRGAKEVGCNERYIIEHGFHSNYDVAKWLYSDANLKKLAEVEAEIMAKHHKLTKKQTSFKVQVLSDTLNVRKVADWNAEPITTVKKGQWLVVVDTVTAKNGSTKMYKLESGLYITSSEKYVKKF